MNESSKFRQPGETVLRASLNSLKGIEFTEVTIVRPGYNEVRMELAILHNWTGSPARFGKMVLVDGSPSADARLEHERVRLWELAADWIRRRLEGGDLKGAENGNPYPMIFDGGQWHQLGGHKTIEDAVAIHGLLDENAKLRAYVAELESRINEEQS